MKTLTEEQARMIETCPACGNEKGIGPIVCWNCFKYRSDITPLKYFNGSFAQWLNSEVA